MNRTRIREVSGVSDSRPEKCGERPDRVKSIGKRGPGAGRQIIMEHWAEISAVDTIATKGDSSDSIILYGYYRILSIDTTTPKIGLYCLCT